MLRDCPKKALKEIVRERNRRIQIRGSYRKEIEYLLVLLEF
jgi:hypothetical protein